MVAYNRVILMALTRHLLCRVNRNRLTSFFFAFVFGSNVTVHDRLTKFVCDMFFNVCHLSPYNNCDEYNFRLFISQQIDRYTFFIRNNK